jgi:hypothetical protein
VNGWKRLLGRRGEPLPPSVVVEMSAEDSKALVHMFAEEIPILVTCGGPLQPTPAEAETGR